MPSLDDPVAIEELGEALRAAGLDGAGVRGALGEGDILSRAVDIPLHLRRLEGAGELGTIIRLFMLDLPVAAADLERALPPFTTARLEALGLVEAAGGEVRPLVRIVPHDKLLIVSDRRLVPGAPAQADHVAGVHYPSVTLAHMSVRRPVSVALDVGTGNGIQAILTSPHAGHVVATDLNERALEFAAFNARLNGVTNVEFRAGSFFEPVAGERFGLVTSNPPYVISPETEYLYRDGGLPGDSVSHGVVAAVPEHLEEGGFATLLVSWVHPPGEDWSAPLREWVAGSGCDAWLLHYKTEDPLTHAANWTRDDHVHDPEGFGAALDRWREYFARLGIEAIAHGTVVLRRRSGGANWVRTDDQPNDRLGPASDQILRVFAAQDFLEGLTDEQALLRERFTIAPRAALEQRVVSRGGEWEADEITLALGEGVGFRAGLDQHTARLLAGLDGRRTLAELADELAASLEADAAKVAAGAVPIFRTLLGAGFLVREGAPLG